MRGTLAFSSQHAARGEEKGTKKNETLAVRTKDTPGKRTTEKRVAGSRASPSKKKDAREKKKSQQRRGAAVAERRKDRRVASITAMCVRPAAMQLFSKGRERGDARA